MSLDQRRQNRCYSRGIRCVHGSAVHRVRPPLPQIRVGLDRADVSYAGLRSY